MSLITADFIAQVAVSSSSSAVAAYLNTEITREKKTTTGAMVHQRQFLNCRKYKRGTP
jgi:hypothetical protein